MSHPIKYLLLSVITCVWILLLASPAAAFKDLGTQPINLGDRIVVTVGADEITQFTFTPDRNMRVNIWQDCDRYMMLIHIDPFHMDSWQQHWGADIPFPSKGITFSMKAGTTYTMGVASPAHFEGGTFTVYFDLVSYLPDDYFYSGVQETEPTIPQITITPETIVKTTNDPITVLFGDPEYGSLAPDSVYTFEPSLEDLLRHECFHLLYSNGKSMPITPDDLTYTNEDVLLDGKPLYLEFPTGESMIPFDTPGSLTIRMNWADKAVDIPIEIIEPPQNDTPNVESAVGCYAYTENFILPYDTLKLCTDYGYMLQIANEEYRIEVDPQILGIFYDVGQPLDLQISLRPVEYESLTEPQKRTLDGMSYTALYHVSYFYDENVLMLPSPARYTVPAVMQTDSNITDYSVLYISDDGERISPYTEPVGSDRISFHSEFPGLFVVYNTEGSAPEHNAPSDLPAEPPYLSTVEFQTDGTLTLPSDQLDLWHAENTALTVQASEITAVFPPSVLYTIANSDRNASEISISLATAATDTLSEAQSHTLSMTAYSALYELSVFSGENAVHELGGNAEITVPGAFLPDTEAAGYTVCRIDEDGTVLPLPSHDSGDKLIFETSHFSLFAVLYHPNFDALPMSAPITETDQPMSGDLSDAPDEAPQTTLLTVSVILIAVVSAVVGFLCAVLILAKRK